MRKPKVGESIVVFCETNEDWYGSFKIADDKRYNFVLRVTLLKYHDNKGWKVSIWGNDDFGQEMEFPINAYQKAKDMFLEVISQPKIRRAFLQDLGFVDA